ncbi:hypothetical protein ACIPRI_18375 [Variovorax sp. LARHSF232]
MVTKTASVRKNKNNDGAASFHVLDVTVSCADAQQVRRAIARCPGAGVVRCRVLLHERCSTSEDDAPRVRLMIRLAQSSYLHVLHALLQAVPTGELGRLMSWRDHLKRCGLGAAH